MKQECLICGVDEEEKRTTKGEDAGEKLKQFAAEYLLELEGGALGKEEDEGDPKRMDRRNMTMCARCQDLVKQAQELYLELVEVVTRFRAVQQVIVMDVQRRLPGLKKKWRDNLGQKKYKFSGDFVVRPLGDDESASKPKSPEPVNIDKERMEVEGAVVKSEVLSDCEFLEPEEDEDAVDLKHQNSGNVSERDPLSDGRERNENVENADDWEWTGGNEDDRYVPCRNKALLKRVIKPQPEEEDTSKKRRRNQVDWLHQSCDICGETLPTVEMSEHVLHHVGREYLYKCPNSSCLFVFPHLYAMRRHIKGGFCNSQLLKQDKLTSVLPKEPYLCDQCGTALWSINSLQTHLQEKHEDVQDTEEEAMELCPISGCGKIFHLRQSVEVHLALNHNQKSAEFQVCNDCGKKRALVAKMKQHLQQVHNTQEIIQCALCSHQFSSREHLFQHAYLHHLKSEKPFNCDICQQETGNFGEWREHYMLQHQIGDKFYCDQCNHSFWDKIELRTHKHIMHKKLSCGICQAEGTGDGVTFETESKLNIHKARVHGKQVFKCSQCPKSFTSAYFRSEHIQIEHHGLKGLKDVESLCARSAARR